MGAKLGVVEGQGRRVKGEPRRQKGRENEVLQEMNESVMKKRCWGGEQRGRPNPNIRLGCSLFKIPLLKSCTIYRRLFLHHKL